MTAKGFDILPGDHPIVPVMPEAVLALPPEWQNPCSPRACMWLPFPIRWFRKIEPVSGPRFQQPIVGQTWSLRYLNSWKRRRNSVSEAYRLHARLVQSRITFPVLPEIITSKPCWKSLYAKRWVMTGEISTPDSSITDILYQVSYISRP